MIGRHLYKALLLTFIFALSANGQQQNFPGGSSSASSPAPRMGFYFTSDCSTVTNAYCFNTFADTQQAQDCSWTNGSATITCTGSHFTAADVGKSVMGFQQCAGDTALGAGAISASANVTIATFISGTSITISATPANTATLGGGFGGSGACLVWGHLDDTAASAVDTAMQTATTCPKLFLAAANYFFSSPHFFTQPSGCSALAALAGSPNFGNLSLPMGFEIEGRGVGNTAWYLNTNFPNGDACTHKSGPSTNVSGCFAIPALGKWQDFRIDGGSQGGIPTITGKSLIAATVATLQSFSCINEGGSSGGNVGLNMDFLVQLYQVNISGCGTTGLQNAAAAGGDVGYRVVVESSQVNALNNQGELWCYWCDLSMPNSGVTNTQVILNSGTLHLFGGVSSPNNGNGGASTNSGITGYKCIGATPGLLYAHNHTFAFNSGSGSNNNGAIWNATAGCIAKLAGSNVQAQSAGFDYVDGVNATLNIDSATVFSGPFTNQTLVGSITADGHSLFGACTGTATASQTLGLYGTGPNVTATTCTSTAIGSGLVMGQSRTALVLQVSSTVAGVNASSGVVTVLKNGSATTMTCTIGTGTTCQDFTHTVSFVKGDLISIQFTTQAADTLAGVKAFVLWQ